MIYFIRNIVSGKIKIGFSDTPKKRLKDLQTGSHDKLVLIKTIPGAQELEAPNTPTVFPLPTGRGVV